MCTWMCICAAECSGNLLVSRGDKTSQIHGPSYKIKKDTNIVRDGPCTYVCLSWDLSQTKKTNLMAEEFNRQTIGADSHFRCKEC